MLFIFLVYFSGRRFDLSDNLDIVADMEQDSDSDSPMCDNVVSSPMVRDESLRRAIDNLPTEPSTSCPRTNLNMAPSTVKHQTNQERKRKIMEDPKYDDFPWSTDMYFEKEWIASMQRHQSALIPLELVNDNKHW